MTMEDIYYRRNLHHYHPDGYPLFITFRLAGSLPSEVLAQLLIESLVHEQANHRGRSAKYPVTDTLRLLKGRTARDCNLELDRNGSFWQHESYDHVIRDEKELERIILYILNNPVEAGLAKEWKEWQFTYVSRELGLW